MLLAFLIPGVGQAIVAERGQNRDERIEHTAQVAAQTARELKDATRRNVLSARQGCRRLNIVRRNQARVIEDQVNTTAATLNAPNGLGVLEPFRPLIARQNRTRIRSLEESRRSVRDFPVRGEPYLVDCVRAYPVRP